MTLARPSDWTGDLPTLSCAGRGDGMSDASKPAEAAPKGSDALKAKMQTATLVEKQVFAGGRLGIFKLRPDNGMRWHYQAGQYTTLGLDTPDHGFVPRAYSIAGSPLDDGLEFYIALVDNGHLTPTIF